MEGGMGLDFKLLTNGTGDNISHCDAPGFRGDAFWKDLLLFFCGGYISFHRIIAVTSNMAIAAKINGW